MYKTLSGPTSHKSEWNSVYVPCLSANCNEIDNLRMTIAHHGAGHAIVQALAGVRNVALHMPSLFDTAHVAVAAPIATMPQAGNSEQTVATELSELCYQLAGYVAEYFYNEGEHRGIAGLSDVEAATDTADKLAFAIGEDPSRIIAAAVLVVEQQLAENIDVIEDLVARLTGQGFVSQAEFAALTSHLPPCDLSALVLAMLTNPLLSDEMDRIHQQLS